MVAAYLLFKEKTVALGSSSKGIVSNPTDLILKGEGHFCKYLGFVSNI